MDETLRNHSYQSMYLNNRLHGIATLL